jgi:hypothetical protein
MISDQMATLQKDQSALKDKQHDNVKNIDINIQFVEGKEAKDILLCCDDYLERMNPFERSIRRYDYTEEACFSDKPIVLKDVSLEQFKEHVENQVVAWTLAEKKEVLSIISSVKTLLSKFKFK